MPHPREVPLPEPKRVSQSLTNHHDRMEELRKLDAEAETGGGPERREREHKAGKLTAPARTHLLPDENTFEGLNKFMRHRCTDFAMDERRPAGDGVCTGVG